MKELNSNMVKIGSDLKEEMKAIVNKLTEAAVTKLTMQAQANMTTINTNITALITDMKEASRGLIYATGHNQTKAQITQGSQNKCVPATYNHKSSSTDQHTVQHHILWG
eukprot:3661938-Ditylum_brightwellii.AAC.1